jgi:hypothetical protein
MTGPVGPADVDGALVVLQSNGDDDPFLVLLFLFAGGLFAIYWGWKRYRRYTLVRDTPTAKVRSMAVGRTELEGRAQPAEETFSAPFTGEECLYADWQVQEYRYDQEDDRHEWVTIDSGELRTSFYLEDDTGRVLVTAEEGADFDLSGDRRRTITVGGGQSPPAAVEDFIEAERGDGDLTNVLGDAAGSIAEVFTDDGRIGHSSNRRRYTQSILPVGETVYVFGSARPVPVSEVPDREAGANEDLLAVEADGGTGMFFVSDRKEETLAKHYSRMAPLAVFGGLAASAVGLYFLLSWYVLV